MRVTTRPIAGEPLSESDEEEPTDPGLGIATPLPLPAAEKRNALRRRLVLEVLLSAVPGLPSRTRSLVLSRGLVLEAVCSGTPVSLAERLETSACIAERFQAECAQYVEGRAARASRGLSSAAELRAHVARLRERTEEFARCQDEHREEKRARRQRLKRATTEVLLLMAERGEQGILREVQRLSSMERVVRLESLADSSEV